LKLWGQPSPKPSNPLKKPPFFSTNQVIHTLFKLWIITPKDDENHPFWHTKRRPVRRRFPLQAGINCRPMEYTHEDSWLSTQRWKNRADIHMLSIPVLAEI